MRVPSPGSVSPVERYLERLGRSLWSVPWRRTRVLGEARDHLLEAVEAGIADGLSPADAEASAVARFGSEGRLVAAEIREAGLLWAGLMKLVPTKRGGAVVRHDTVEIRVDFALRQRAEAALVDVLTALPPWPCGVIQRGLLRANSVLVGGFVATDHRACPLASAVWESTGREPASMFQVQLGLAELGLTTEQGRIFAEAFDQWAAAGGCVRTDADGMRVLTHIGRSRLLRLFENLTPTLPELTPYARG